jgi:hypothetical protein
MPDVQHRPGRVPILLSNRSDRGVHPESDAEYRRVTAFGKPPDLLSLMPITVRGRVAVATRTRIRPIGAQSEPSAPLIGAA